MNKSTMFLIFGTLVGTTSLSFTLAPPIVAEANSDEETQKEEETSFIPLEEGAENDTVLEVEEYLETLDYIAVAPDYIYDEETTEAVETFQAENSLGITGVVDEETFDTLKLLAEDTVPVEEEPEADSAEEAADDEQDTEAVTEEKSDDSASREQSEDTEAEAEAAETEEADQSDEKQNIEVLDSSGETEPAKEAESENNEENIATEEPEKEIQKETEPPSEEDTEEESSKDEEPADEEITDDEQQSAVASFSTFSMQPASISTSLLKIGVSGSEVQQLQENLNAAGFHVTDNPTTYFGPKTEAAVKDFQRANKLVVDGVAGSNTLSVLEEVLSSSSTNEKNTENNKSDNVSSPSFMKEGVSGSNVQQLQKDLNEAGFHVVNAPTVHFGPKTDQAVRDFQKANRLVVDGVAGPNTLTKLQEVLNGSANDYKSLKQGASGAAVKQLQTDLNKAGFFVTENPITYFGPKTERAVKDLQRTYHLPVTGVANTATLETLTKTLNTYSKGDRNEKIRKYQQLLNEAGFFVTENPITYFGPKTESTVRGFQRAYNLPVTGMLDSQSIQKLEDVTQSINRLERGVRHASVINLQQLLNKAGFHVTATPINYFGPKTEDALIDFQQTYKLKADGVATDEVLDALNKAVSERNNALKRYDSNSEVKKLQQTLNALGYTVTSNPTNYFGPKTESALKVFQRAEGLPVTGMLDSRTAEALEAEMNESIPSPFTSVLSQGDSGDSVIMLKQYLEAAGYSTNTSSTYDQLTADQVKAYQSANGLSASGSANGQTLSSLVEKRGTTYVFSGKQRFGHGVGMTQWGAYGMAQQGYSYDQILKHYYTGIDVVSSDSYKNKTMRVLLGDTKKNSADIESSSAYSIVTTDGDTLFENVSGSTTVTYGSGGNGTYTVTNNGTEKTTTDPIYAVNANNGTIEYDNVTYKGEIHFSKSIVDGKYTSSWVMDVVNHVSIDTYLEGVVPYEMYTSWNEPDAYKAQAVAARSYAMTKIKTSGTFDVYNDTRSQVYHGVPTGSHNSPTILNAIQSTSGQAIHYNGRLVEGVYSASASGHTVDAADVWGNNVGYLIGVPDPYDPSQYNQVSWTESFSLKDLSAVDYFKNENKGEVLALQPTMKNERLQSIEVIMEKGTITLTGDQFRSAVDSNAMKSNILSIEEIN